VTSARDPVQRMPDRGLGGSGRDQPPFSGRGLHGRVVDSLGVRIVSGELAPGEVIDLDAVAEEHTASRTVVREAVKVLAGKGLVDALPRRGTFVRDRAAWSMFDAEVLRWRCEGPVDEELLRDLQEVRAVVEPAAARLAAARRTPVDLEGLHDAMSELRATVADVGSHVEADLVFHRRIALASGNEMLQAFALVLEPVQRARDRLVVTHLSEDARFLEAHERVLRAIEREDAAGAAASMEALVQEAHEDFEAVLARRATPLAEVAR
jgi:GntR family galactonate operon transcriptional repressor